MNRTIKILCITKRLYGFSSFNQLASQHFKYTASSASNVSGLTNEIAIIEPDVLIFDLQFPHFRVEEYFESDGFVAELPILILAEKDDEQQAESLFAFCLSDWISTTQIWRLPHAVSRIVEMAQLRSEQQKLTKINEESRDLTRALVENAPFGVVSFDMEGRIGLYNKLFVKMTGLSEDENLDGFDVKPLFYGTTETLLSEVLQGNVKVFPCKATKPSPENKVEIQITAAPFRNKSGQIVGGTLVLSDLTAQRVVERQKKESDERFSQTFSASPLAMAIIETDNARIAEVNNAWTQLTGNSADESRNLNIFELHLIDNQQYEAIDKNVRSEGRLNQTRLGITTKSGEHLDTLATVTLFQSNGKTMALLILVDITERLRQNERLLILSNAIHQMPLAVITAELDGTVRYANPQANLLLGYSVDELINQKINWLQDTSIPKPHQNVYDQLKKGKTWSGEIQQNRKNGEPIWVYLTIVPIKDENENIIRYVLIEEDITLRKDAEEALQRNKMRYKLMFMNNPIPMWTFDIETLQIKEVNQKACEEYGYSEEEFRTLNLHNIWTEEMAATYMERYNNRSNDTQSYNNVLSQHRYKDGTVVDVRINVYPVLTQGSDSIRMVIAQNNTSQVKAQKLLEEAIAKAEESNRLKTNFLNNISHEIRTPLNGILGVTTLLSDPELQKDEIPELLEIVELSTTRLTQTITDIMDVSLLTSNQMELHLKLIPIKKLIDRTKLNFEQASTRKGLNIKTKCPQQAEEISLLLDPELTLKALGHLVRNAIKYTPNGTIELGVDEVDNNLRIYVKDTGIGISQESIEKVLQYFLQEDDSYARPYEGSGLGLPIANGLIKLMGGHLSIESKKGHGSVFGMCFPKK